MYQSIVSSTLADVDLEPDSIPSGWLLSGQPETRSKVLGKSRDRLGYVVLWECGAVSYKWHYSKDEVLVVLEGEAFITNETGEERRIGPGDVVFFPAGTSSKWHVPKYIRKVAFLRHTMPRPFGLAVLAWNLFLRIVGLQVASPLMMVLMLDPIGL